MQSLPPLALPISIVMAVAFVGAIIAFLRDRGRFSGYKELMGDAIRLSNTLGGEVFRDGDDLVIYGTFNRMPVQIRFSHSESTPGLNIRMGALSTINLFFAPRAANAVGGRQIVRTPDEMFNTRVEARTDHPTEARLLLGQRAVMPSLTKLCRSSQTYVRITRGQVELIDLAPPSVATVINVRMQVELLSSIASALAELPGAEKVVVEPLKRERRVLLKAAISAGAVAAVAAVAVSYQASKRPAEPAAAKTDASAELAPGDAPAIPGAKKWKVVNEVDFDADATAWLRARSVPVSGRVSADFSGNGNDSDVAYVLDATGEKRRVVVLSRGNRLYDANFAYVGIAARVPKTSFASIEWAGTPPASPEGDGLLLTRSPRDRASGIIIFKQGGRMISAVPRDYQTIRLE